MPFLKQAGGPTLYYEVDDYTDPWRNAPYLLLQHGYGRNSVFWYRWVPYLSRYYRVVRPDMRGFGRSREGFDAAGGFKFADLVGDIVAVIDAIGAERVHYCGEAFGGTLGMQVAAEHPDRIRTLNLISAPVFLHHQVQDNYTLGEASWIEALRKHGIKKWAEETNLISRFPRDASPAFLEWYNDTLARTDLETLIAFSKLCSTYDMTEFLAGIESPVLGIYPRSRPEQIELLRSRVKRVSIVNMDIDSFMFYIIYPRVCAQTVLQFAAQHDGVTCVE